jgi:hypothetical protein
MSVLRRDKQPLNSSTFDIVIASFNATDGLVVLSLSLSVLMQITD